MEDHEEQERRHTQPGRRTADAVAFRESATYEAVIDEVADVAKVLKTVGISWKRWVVFAGVFGAMGGAVIGAVNWLGGRYQSPYEVRQETAARIASIEDRVGNVEEAMDLMSYLLCVQIRRTDPAAVPPKCNESSIRRLAPK